MLYMLYVENIANCILCMHNILCILRMTALAEKRLQLHSSDRIAYIMLAFDTETLF